MSSIGGYTMVQMIGELAWPEVELARRKYPGEDGYEYQNLGMRETPSKIETIATAANDSAAVDLMEAYLNLQGSLVAVVDRHGTTYSYVLVAQVEVSIAACVAPTNNPTDTRIVRAAWTLETQWRDA